MKDKRKINIKGLLWAGSLLLYVGKFCIVIAVKNAVIAGVPRNLNERSAQS